MLNRWQRDGAISIAVFFRSIPGMLSGPHAFLGSRFSKDLATSETDSWMEVSVMPVVGEKGTAGRAG